MTQEPCASPASSTPMPRRILSIWLARLSVDRWRRASTPEADAAPTALILETAHGPRITAANDAGLAAGARPGMLLADARALCPDLAAVPADPAGDLAALEKLALWAQRWGPWSALDPPDGLLVDVTGAAHLWGAADAGVGAALLNAAAGLGEDLTVTLPAAGEWDGPFLHAVTDVRYGLLVPVLRAPTQSR